MFMVRWATRGDALEQRNDLKKSTGIDVHVTSGPTSQWADKAKIDADVIYSGSEAMMSDFESIFTDKILKDSIEPLLLTPCCHFRQKR